MSHPLLTMLETLEKLDSQFDLNDWESRFVQDMRHSLKFRQPDELTEKQQTKIRDIYNSKSHLLEHDDDGDCESLR